MIVLSDTTPINHLLLAGHIDILAALFKQVTIPAAVQAELLHPATPEVVRAWVIKPPSWLIVKTPVQLEAITLGRGEVEAISLAIEMKADLLLMDDRRARREAESRGLSVVGTLNVLEAAAERELLDLPTAVTALQATHFHISQQIIDRALENDAQRKVNKPGP